MYLSVTTLAATYLICVSKVRHRRVPYRFKDLYCVDFAENILFGIYGMIYLPR